MANIQIPITENGTTTLATAGKYCDRNIEVNVNVNGATNDRYEEGKQAEYDRLWDALQQKGSRTHYAYAFAYTGWSEDIFNPKYPITPASTLGIQNMFNWNPGVVDTKVAITAYGNCSNAFGNATKLKRTHIIFNGATNVANMFLNCTALEELYCEGELTLSLSLAQSNLLNATSVQSVIDCLADLTGQTAQTLTLHATVGANLTQAQKDAISAKNWTLVY